MYALRDLGRFPEAAEDARRALAVAREVGHPFAEVVALLDLALDAAVHGDLGDAVRLARQASQVPGDIPGFITRTCSVWLTEVLIQANDFAAAERVCADGLASSRDVGDMVHLPTLLARMALLNLQAAPGTLRLTCEKHSSSRGGPASCSRSTWTAGAFVRCNRTPGRDRHVVGRVCGAPAARGLAWQTHGSGKNRCAQPGRRWAPARRGAAEERGAAMSGPPRPSTPSCLPAEVAAAAGAGTRAGELSVRGT